MSETALGFYWQPMTDTITQQLDLLRATGATAVVVPYRLLDVTPVAELRQHNIKLMVDWTVFAGAEVRRAFPDSIPVEASGTPFGQEDWYLPACPNHPELRQHHLRVMGEVFEQWGAALDGLWLDFIRYPVRWEGQSPRLRELCFCRNCLNLFLQQDRAHYSAEETRALAQTILQTRAAEWIAWKCARIVQFVAAVKAQISQLPRPLQLGIFSLPWRRLDLNGAILNVAAQDLGQLANLVDVISPMVYHKLCHQPVDWIAAVVQDVADWTQRPVLAVIQTMDEPESLSPMELDAALRNAFQPPARGSLLFTLAPLLTSPEKAQVVRSHFEARQK